MEMNMVNFDKIRGKIQTKYSEYLGEFFDYFFDDLLLRLEKKDSESSKIDKTVFSMFMDLPHFICNKIFEAFNINNDGWLSKLEFNLGINSLYFGSLETLEKITFEIFNFSRSDKISMDDVTLLLNNFNYSDLYPKNCQKIIQDFFLDRKFLTFQEYVQTIQNTNSNIFLMILIFLYNKTPFTRLAIKCFEEIKMAKGNIENSKQLKSSEGEVPEIVSPTKEFLWIFPNLKVMSMVKRKNGTKNVLKFEISQVESPEGKELIDTTSPNDQQFYPKVAFEGETNFQNSKKEILDVYFSNSIANSFAMNKRNISNIFPLKDNCFSNNFRTNPNSKNNSISKNESVNNSISKNVSINNSISKNVSIDNSNINFNSISHSVIKTTEGNYSVSPKRCFHERINTEMAITSVALEDNRDHFTFKYGIERSEIYDTIFEINVNKLSSKSKLMNCKIRIVGKEIFTFKFSESKNRYVFANIQPLSGYFVTTCDETTFLGTTLYPLALLNKYGNTSANLNNLYFLKEKSKMEECVTAIEKILKVQKINDYYNMIKEIGRGQFGHVYLAINKMNQKHVAIKKTRKSKLTPKEAGLIRNEIDIMKYMSFYGNSNVIKFYDAFEDKNYIYIVMEYSNAGTLQSYISKKKMIIPEPELKSIIMEIASGLSFLNKLGIVHRDIKTENILISQTNSKIHVKLIDFGLSKVLAKNEKAYECFGTLVYSAPEKIFKGGYDFKVDIWSFGVLIYYLMCGNFPFDGNKISFEEIAKKICNNNIEFEKLSYYSNDIKALMKLCLYKNPIERIDIENIENIINKRW